MGNGERMRCTWDSGVQCPEVQEGVMRSDPRWSEVWFATRRGDGWGDSQSLQGSVSRQVLPGSPCLPLISWYGFPVSNDVPRPCLQRCPPALSSTVSLFSTLAIHHWCQNIALNVVVGREIIPSQRKSRADVKSTLDSSHAFPSVSENSRFLMWDAG